MNVKKYATNFHIKEISEAGLIKGYGSVFNNVDNVDDVVERGAFNQSLGNAKRKGLMPAMLWMHDSRKPIGVWKEMREDENGLYVEGQLALGTQLGDEAYKLLQMGAISGLSIGYKVKKSTIDQARRVNLLKELELIEVSIVTFPANDEARVLGVKEIDGLNSLSDCEKFLRDAHNFSQKQAVAFVSRIKRFAIQGEPEQKALQDTVAALRRSVEILTPTAKD